MQKVRKAIIPAAGLGTRFLPITKAVPKPMLSVIDKPTIQYITEELSGLGIEEIIIVVSPGSDVIKKHFGKAEALEEALLKAGKQKLYEIERETQKFNVKFVEQKRANGLAGAILCAEPYINGEPFALLLGDELLRAKEGEPSCIKRLIDVFEKTGKSVIAAMEVFGDEVSKYGNIGIRAEEDGIITVDKIVEKPSVNDALSNYAIIGRYVMAGKVMDMLKNLKERNGEIFFTDTLDELSEKGELLASGFKDKRYDVGDKFGYLKANVELALIHPELKDEAREFILQTAKELKGE